MVVTIWNEYRHEKAEPQIAAIYPKGIHGYLAEVLAAPDIEIQLACLDDPECGLSPERLERTDVLLWWGHMYHGEVPQDVVDRVVDRVRRGMGLLVLHSGHHSRVFKTLMGTTGNLVWGDDGYERMFTINPGHPIAKGLPAHFDIGVEEMYGEPFDIPQPNEIVFMSWFETGYLFRSGVVYQRGRGKIFYFQPGHESRTSYFNPYVQTILRNAVRYLAPTEVVDALDCPCVPILKPDDSLR